MVAITATSSATPSIQLALTRARLDQAQRDADRAEQTAKSLRSQANEAEQQAQQKDEQVSSLSSDVQRLSTANRGGTYADPAKARSEPAPQSPQLLDQVFLNQVYKASAEKPSNAGNAVLTNATAATVRNTMGQETGRLVNFTA